VPGDTEIFREDFSNMLLFLVCAKPQVTRISGCQEQTQILDCVRG